MIEKIFIAFISFHVFSYTAFSFSQEVQNKDVVIINNEAAVNTQTQPVTAPALVPSAAKKLRDAREKQEVKTEDTIIKELEKQRLLDEQKRIGNLFGNTQAPVQPPRSQLPSSQWLPFVNKSFVSVGAGLVNYPGAENINSTNFLALFGSFGGYGYEGHLLFDLTLYYSQHYLRTYNVNYQDIREKLHQPAAAMAVKYSPLTGKMKPYVGLSGSFIGRRWFFVHRSGESLENHPIKDIGEKTWHLSFDGGLAVGADLALGKRLGLNVDVRYHWNLYNEKRRGDVVPQYLTDAAVLDERDSVIFSGNVRYYF